MSPGRRSVNSVESSGSTGIMDLYADPDLVQEKKKVKALKLELSSVKSDYERRVIELERENGRIQVALNEANAKVERLDNDRRFLLEREKASSSQLKALEDETLKSKHETEAKLAKLQAQNNELKEKVSTLHEQKSNADRQAGQSSEQAHETFSRLKMELESLKQQLKSESEQRQAIQIRSTELEAELSKAQNEVISLKRRDIGDSDGFIRKELQEKSTNTLQKEVNYLRATKENVQKIKEEKFSLEQQVASIPALRQKLATAEVEVSKLMAEKKRWTGFLQGGDETGVDSPYALAKALAAERLQIASLKEKLGAEAAKQKGLEEHNNQLESQLADLKEKLNALQEKAEKDTRNAKWIEKSRDLAQREVTFLREQLRSYDLEEQQLSTNFDQQKAQRISDLEKLVEDLKSLIADQQSQLKQMDLNPQLERPPVESTQANLFSSESLQKINALEEELSNCTKSKLLLEKEVRSLEDQVLLLEQALGRGEYNPEKTKILQLRDGPENQYHAVRQATLDALREENKALRENLVQQYASERLYPAASLKALEIELERLVGVVDEKEKRMARLKEVYKAKAQEYREAVFSLLGYKVDFQEGRVRLTSTFSDPHDPSFLFTSGENDFGTLQILGGSLDRLSNLSRSRQYYVVEKGSVPAFLASVTLESWERKDHAQAGYGITQSYDEQGDVSMNIK
ncbi:Mitotic spindle assembly checkpoint protein MAD1 [Chytridiales sp. JEL 0842]|nr:Mitotic spindle assembly checkpoint protein MAD1 [Chytridiales sp. JEL 0842]